MDDEEEISPVDAVRERQKEEFRFMMKTPEGRAIMWRLLSKCGIYQNPATFGETDTTYFKCGQQALGQWLISEIYIAAPEFYEIMRRENSDVASTA